MNRLSRIVVLCSLLAATAFEVYLATPEYFPLTSQVRIAFVIGIVAALVAPDAAMAAGLSVAYIAPVLLTMAIGRFRLTYLLIWIGYVLGALTASKPARGWAFPARWRWPLVTWAMVVAAAWPIVLWRECDFDFSMLGNMRSGGLPPAIGGLGILDSVITQLLGLIWLDWLCDRYRAEPAERFDRFVTMPLAVSATLACLLGVYQSMIDESLWSAGQWPSLRRAAGGLLDANASGMVAACWAPAFVAFAYRWPTPRRAVAAISGTALACAAAWSSASRTALLATGIGLGM